MLEKLLPRLKEPSTYAGLGVLAMAFFGWSDDQFNAIVAALVAVAGAVSVFKAEGSEGE